MLYGFGIKQIPPYPNNDIVITYRRILFLLLEILKMELERRNIKKLSIKHIGSNKIFTNCSFGVLIAVHILFKISITFQNLHKLIFILRSYFTARVILESDNRTNWLNILYLRDIGYIRFMTSNVVFR